MDNNRILLYTSSVYDQICSWSKTRDYQDGLNNIRRDMELIDESEAHIVDMLHEWNENDLSDLLHQFEEIEDVVITGSLGLWNGRHTIEFAREDNLEEAFWRCINNMDKVEVYDNNGVIEIEAYHHDGCNHFFIYKLNSKGVNAGDMADLAKNTYHKKIRLYQ